MARLFLVTLGALGVSVANPLCNTKFVSHGATVPFAFSACPQDKVVHPTEQCTGGVCQNLTADINKCCITPQTCAAGFEIHTASTDAKINCPANKIVSPDGKCATQACVSATDSSTCCVGQLCTDGFDLNTASSSKHKCAAGKVVKTGHRCAGTQCANADPDKAACCVAPQNCDAKFQTARAVGSDQSKFSCPASKELKPDAKCAGHHCVEADDKDTCCQPDPCGDKGSITIGGKKVCADADTNKKDFAVATFSSGLCTLLCILA